MTNSYDYHIIYLYQIEPIKLHCTYAIERTDVDGEVAEVEYKFTLPVLPYCWAFESLYRRIGYGESTDLFDFSIDEDMAGYPTIKDFVDVLIEFNEDRPIVHTSSYDNAKIRVTVTELTDELTGERYI